MKHQKLIAKGNQLDQAAVIPFGVGRWPKAAIEKISSLVLERVKLLPVMIAINSYVDVVIGQAEAYVAVDA
jgi:2-phosphoglycerate kinase